MARGCIPIVSNKGGLPEVVEYNKTYLVNNKEEMKYKLEKFLTSNSNELKKYREECIRIARKFSINQTIKKLHEEYTKLF